jgi:phosphohistidine swiveling domain-containing protein
MTTTTASFSFTGDFYTNHARNLVLDGQWRDGYNFLMKGFDGMESEHAFSILKGTHELEGLGENMDLVEKLDEDYQNDVRDLYYWNVFSEVGGKFKFERLITLEKIQDDIRLRGFTSDIPEASVYVDRYMRNTDEQVFTVRYGDRTHEVNFIIAKKFDSNTLPLWTTDEDIPKSAKHYYMVNLKPSPVVIEPVIKEEKAPISTRNIYREESAKNTAKDFNFDNVEDFSHSLRVKVLEAIKERNVEWKTENVNHLGKVYPIRYPVDLAMAYALQRTSLSGLAPKWEPVSEQGLKMGNDSRLHTDLWLALGHNLDGSEYSYDEEHVSVFNHLMIQLQEKSFPAGEFYTLNSAGLKIFKGNVVTLRSEAITKHDILILPHAGPEYQDMAMKAGLVICEVGGKLAHLAIVGREFGLPLIQVENAYNLFKEGAKLTIDFENATIVASN